RARGARAGDARELAVIGAALDVAVAEAALDHALALAVAAVHPAAAVFAVGAGGAAAGAALPDGRRGGLGARLTAREAVAALARALARRARLFTHLLRGARRAALERRARE